MADELVFTAQGELRATTGDGRERRSRPLAWIAAGGDGRPPRLRRGEIEQEIVPAASPSWAFELRDGDGSCAGGFRPFRLRNGGRLHVGEQALSLCGRPWSHEGWRFSAPDGRGVDATVREASNGTPRSVVLAPAAPGTELSALVDALALGCWLILRWQLAPAPDHVLVAAPASTRPPSATAARG